MEEKIIPSSILYNKENNTNIEYLCFTYNVNDKNEKNGNNKKNNDYKNHTSQQVLLFDKIEKEIKLEFCIFKSICLYVNKEKITDGRKMKIYLELFKWFSNKKKIQLFENDIIFNEMLYSIKQYNIELYKLIIDILDNKKIEMENRNNMIYGNCVSGVNSPEEEEEGENSDTNEEMEEDNDENDNEEYKKENNSNYTVQSKEIHKNQLVKFRFRFIIKKDNVNNKNNYLMKLLIY